ncbi:MAG: hypothetical protein CMF22_01545 [Idiomarinaceae bacterium]|nr:hypothetical protein [Idiomarinaceae bacterium]|tara:strand:- start:813 stop:1745 length:933 start_codon:yes stop_codon:yes gene_type:complete
MILDSREFLSKFNFLLSHTNKSFLACSAFIKKTALEKDIFCSNLKEKDVTIVARWQKRDLISKASDLEVYQHCKNMGWRFGISLNLHAKVYLFDEHTVLLGSANLTNKGLGLSGYGNLEYGTAFECSQLDLDKIKAFVESEVTWIDDNLFDRISRELEATPREISISDLEWSDGLLQLVNAPVRFLLLSELLNNTPESLLNPNFDDSSIRSDLDLLGIDIDRLAPQQLSEQFRKLRLFCWLLNELKANGDSLSFGAISSKLHGAVINEPRPNRVDIKEYVRTLFQWAKFETRYFRVERPNHSEIIHLRRD